MLISVSILFHDHFPFAAQGIHGILRLFPNEYHSLLLYAVQLSQRYEVNRECLSKLMK